MRRPRARPLDPPVEQAPISHTPAPRPTLARPGDPYVCANGVVVPPELPRRSAFVDVADRQTTEPAEFRALKKRNLKDLPAPVSLINGVSCVFMYTMLGIGDREIADALQITVPQVYEMRRHSAYLECFNSVMAEFINANSEHISARLQAAAQGALTNVFTLAHEAKKEEVKLRANQDILDRSGTTAKSAEMRGQTGIKNELRIVMVKGDGNQVNIDLNIGGS